MIVPRALLPTALVLSTSLGLVKAQCPLEITGLPTFTGDTSLDTMPLLLPFGLQAGVFIDGTSVTANGPTEITVTQDAETPVPVDIQASVNGVSGPSQTFTPTDCGASTPYVLDVSPYFCNLVVDLAAGDKIQFNSGGSPYPPIEGYGQATVPIDASISYTYYTGGSAVSGTFNVGTCSNAVSCTGSGCGTTGNPTCFATLVGLPTIMVSQEEPNVHYFDFFTDIIFTYFKLDTNGPFGPLMEDLSGGYVIEAEIGENLNGDIITCGVDCTDPNVPTPCDVSSLYCELAIDADNVVIDDYNTAALKTPFMIDDKVWVLVNTEVFYCNDPGCNPDKDEDGISFNVGNCDRTLPGGVTQETPEDLIRKACPCEIFTNHGQKQSCVNDKAKQLVKTGVITSEEKNALVDLFNKSKCPTTRSLRNGGK